MKRFLTGFFLVVVYAVSVFGQTTAGKLAGTVSSTDGVLPGATIVVTDKKTGKELTTTTGDEGNFLFPQLEFGNYTVTVTSEGFKKYIADDVKIDVGRTYNLNPALELGSLTETVTVEAGADVISGSTAQVSNTVSPQQILSLPLVTRNPLALASLQAGVSANSAQNTTINGMRTTFTNITRDGINIQDTFIRSNATDFSPGRPSVDDTGEFTIATSNAEADQGYGGAQIRLVTPRGTKDFHGALFAYNRNSAFSANNFFNNRAGRFVATDSAVIAGRANVGDERTPLPFRNRNQFGGKVSGPLPVPGLGEGTPFFFKDKAVFFFAYEGVRDPVSSTATRTILTPSARTGGFSFARASAGNVINNVNGLSCPSGAAGSTCSVTNILSFARSFGGALGTVPGNISPLVQSQILSLLPTDSNFTGGDSFNTAGYRFIRRADQTRNQYSSRIDVDFNDKNSLSGILNYNKEENLRAGDSNTFSVIPGITQSSANTQFTMAYRSIVTDRFVNEVRGGVFTSDVPFDRTDPLPNFLLGSYSGTAFSTNPAGLISNPVETFLNQGRNTKAYNLQDNADYIFGKHSFKFGGQAQIFQVDSYNDASLLPIIALGAGNGTPGFTTAANFANSCTGPCASGQTSLISSGQLGTANSLLALLGGLSNASTQSFNVADVNRGFESTTLFTPFRYENYSLYFSDRWQITKELTLSLGIRYELFPALRLVSGNALEPIITDLDNPIPSLLDPNGSYGLIGTNSGRENSYYKTDTNNFAPNIGFAYTPSFETGVGKLLFGGSGKTVIRGGYSHVFGNDSIVTSINNAAVGNVGLGRTPTNILNQNVQVDAGIATIPAPAFVTPPRSYLLNNGQNNNFGTVFAIDPNLETPMIKQYSFGIQREFFGNTALEIRYVGTSSNNLARGIDLNQVDIFNNGFLADFERARANLTLTGNAFCTTAGCQTLQIFRQTGAGINGQAGRLLVGNAVTGANPGAVGLSATTFTNALNNGTPADLAINFVNSSTNLNNQPNSTTPNALPRINFLPNPGAGIVDYFINGAEYNYNSVQIELRRRFADGLYFQGNYTFSKNLTNAVGTSQNLFEPLLDNNNPDLEFQRADYDLTHVFNFNGIYQLPFGKGKMFLNQGGFIDKVFGGFELSGLMSWTSGAPITFVDTRGTLNRTARSSRQTPLSSLNNDQIRSLTGIFEANGNIYFIDPSILSSNGRASEGFGTNPFNGQVFFNTNPGQTGNIGRSLISGPTYFNVNAALLKNIRFGENLRVQLRAEGFNLFNNVNFNVSAAQQLQSITSTTFGQFTSTANGAREFQFAARFEF